MKGMIGEDPEVRDRVTHLRLEAAQIKLDDEWHEVSGAVLLFVQLNLAGEIEKLGRRSLAVQADITCKSDVDNLVRFLFEEVQTPPVEELIPKRLDQGRTAEVIRQVCTLLEEFDKHSDEDNEKRFREAAEALGVKLGDLLMPVRVALTGSRVSPPLFESIRVLGVEKTLIRLQNALRKLEGS